MTKALGTFSVFWGRVGQADDDALEVLALADEYRQELCALYQERHERTTDLRNSRFPALWDALTEWEAAKARVSLLEKKIKVHHARIRDRNALKVDARIDTTTARAARDTAYELVKAGRERHATTVTAWRLWFASRADWKNVKSLDKRRVLYAAMTFPTTDEVRNLLAAAFEAARKKSKRPESVKLLDADLVDLAALEEFGRLDMQCDLRERELSAKYQAAGLSSGIRGEIDEASLPKKPGADGPGMVYECGRRLEVQPWRKLTTCFAGGLSIEAAQEGTSQFRLTHEGGVKWRVQQQIGTKDHPRLVSYRVTMHRPFPPGTRFQRWSVSIQGEAVVFKNKLGQVRETTQYRSTAIPIVAADAEKPTGVGTLHCRLSWRRVPGGGVQVAEFRGAHVNERLVLPAWLVAARMDTKATLAGCDGEANEFLSLLGERPKTGRRQGVVALRQHCFANPDDTAARSLLSSMVLEVHVARRRANRAIRAIEKIYETATRRICQLHGELRVHSPDLARRKKYAARDLLAQDAAPPAVRELLHAVAPGKLKSLLVSYGLLASDEVIDWDAAIARETDVVRGWVESLGRRQRRETKEAAPVAPVVTAAARGRNERDIRDRRLG